MKPASSFLLLSIIATLCLASCSPAPNADGELVAGPATDQSEGTEGSEVLPGEATEGGPQIVQSGINVKRLRLPDMEKLPSDRELTSTQQPDNGSGGVIARPPSE